jgi:arginase family enzyme
VEGTLILVAEPFSGRTDVGPRAGAVARALGEPLLVDADASAVRAALVGAQRPIVVSAECSVATGTLPWLAEHHGDARVLWLDAHADFNTPDTSPSGYVGGMPVAAATGMFDARLQPPLLPADRLVYFGLRDVDPGEQALLDRSGATIAASADDALDALGDAPVFVHFDADVIEGYPSAFPPPPGGPGPGELRALLADVAARNPIVGITIASVAGPVEPVLSILEPLL